MCEDCKNGTYTKWFTVPEAAEYTGRHPRTLRNAAARGEFTRYQQGMKVYYKREELDHWLEPKPA